MPKILDWIDYFTNQRPYNQQVREMNQLKLDEAKRKAARKNMPIFEEPGTPAEIEGANLTGGPEGYKSPLTYGKVEDMGGLKEAAPYMSSRDLQGMGLQSPMKYQDVRPGGTLLGIRSGQEPQEIYKAPGGEKTYAPYLLKDKEGNLHSWPRYKPIPAGWTIATQKKNVWDANLDEEIEGGGMPPGTSGVKQLDKSTAAAILSEAGGDKNKAREIARQRGYKF